MTLEGCRAKIRRAKVHFDAVEREITVFLRDHPYRVTVDREAENLFVVRSDNPPAVPTDDWAVIIGDCVHNLRASLDYIAWELAGGIRGDTETQFPIFINEQGWRRMLERRKMISRVQPRRARELIEFLQPYRATNPAETALNGLRVLDDADKHKLLTVTAAAAQSVSFAWLHNYRVLDHRITFFPENGLTHKAVFAEIELPDPPPYVEMESNIAATIVFGEAVGLGPRMEVLGSLRAIISEVEVAADRFNRSFF